MVKVVAIEPKSDPTIFCRLADFLCRISAVALHRTVHQGETVHCNSSTEGCQAERHGLTMRVLGTMIDCLEFRYIFTERMKQETLWKTQWSGARFSSPLAQARWLAQG
jgi:hypothetical protein